MIQIEKEKWSPGSATRRKHLSKGSALRVSRKRRPIWTAGKSVGPTRASMARPNDRDRKSTRLNSSHGYISYAVFCLKKKKKRCYSHRRHHSLPTNTRTA